MIYCCFQLARTNSLLNNPRKDHSASRPLSEWDESSLFHALCEKQIPLPLCGIGITKTFTPCRDGVAPALRERPLQRQTQEHSPFAAQPSPSELRVSPSMLRASSSDWATRANPRAGRI